MAYMGTVGRGPAYCFACVAVCIAGACSHCRHIYSAGAGEDTEAIFTLIAGIALVCIAGNGLFIYLAAYGQHRRTDADSAGDERRLDADVRRLDADVTSVKKTDGSDIPAGWGSRYICYSMGTDRSGKRART